MNRKRDSPDPHWAPHWLPARSDPWSPRSRRRPAQPTIVDIEQIIVTGTRVPDRSATETAVPVDVVSGETLSNVGVTEINQALSVMLPSFNFPRPGLADGTDTIRPATLRGLSPDQTLVMMNSKRRHASSLVNVNGTIGRGAAAVDLNTIPASIVQSIEVLRDGASAQYGSDAIAGVINVRLKQDDDGGDVMVAYGARDFDYDVPVGAAPAGATWPAPSSIGSSGTDGESLTVSAWKGLGFGDTGYLTIAARIQGPGAHRARRLRLSAAVSARRHRVRSSRSGVRPVQCLVRRAGARAAHVLRQRRRRARRRRIHLRLGELSGARIALGRPVQARARRPQRHRDLSGRVPADHHARGHGLQRGGAERRGRRQSGLSTRR